ncbi:MAG TPA: DinB family protein [Longimicrobium sp.]|nr:DinB family protein [Longimicrobium sp.]
MSTSAASSQVRQLALGDFEHELAQTRRVLERVPDDRFDFKPHPKSFSIGHLATHLANLPFWLISILSDDEFDLATVPPTDPATLPTTRDAVLAKFDENVATVRAAFDAADDEALLRPWTLRKGEHVVMTVPRAAAIRTIGISHMVHHRGQMTLYLRLLDIPVPGIYGPSADEGNF